MRTGLLMILTGAALVWALAIVGAITVVRGVFSESRVVPSVSLLETDSQADDVPGAEIAGLPRYPGAVRAEYREAVWAGKALIEAEYRTQHGTAAVLQHLHRVLEAGDWEIRSQLFDLGEHVFEVTLGEVDVTIEVERHDDATEIEIERVEPLRPRGSTTGR